MDFLSSLPHKKRELSFSFKELCDLLKIQRIWCDWFTCLRCIPSEDKLVLHMMDQRQEKFLGISHLYTQTCTHTSWINRCRDIHGGIMVR